MSLMLEQTRSDIMKGSKSFSLASFFFDEEARVGAWQLYSWCRHCDDQIDLAKDANEALSRLQELKLQTHSVFQLEQQSTHPWNAFQTMVVKHRVPMTYAQDLLRGMQWDVEGAHIQSEADLIDYCYCVAGTVGLMMTHVMKLSDVKAMNQAVSLGIALQLTNISRDLKEDFERGRIYIPKDWMSEFNLAPEELMNLLHRSQLQKLAQRLLALADHYYEEGMSGLSALSLRAAWAVVIATYVYRDIGHQVRQGNLSIFDRRVVVSTPRKIWLLMKSSFYLLRLLPSRIRNPWKSVEIESVWKKQELFNEQGRR